MGSPNFAKPRYATGIAFMPTSEFDENDIREIIDINEWDCDDANTMAESILRDNEHDYILEESESCQQTLEQLKSIVDEALTGLLPSIGSMRDEIVSEWFTVDKEYGYHEGVGFVIKPSDIIYSHTENYADAYWQLICNSLDENQATYKNLFNFFEIVRSAYDYMMSITGFTYSMEYILGGWCNNSSTIADKPVPNKIIANLKLVEDINIALESLLEVA